MSDLAIADTGPIVAFFQKGAQHHRWACETMRTLRPPLLTCEPVLAEAAYLLSRSGCDPDFLLAWIDRGALKIALTLETELGPIRQLLRRYRDRPMSLADACLVRLAEMHERARVWTLDSDFHVYRRLGRLVIPTLMPE